jgi:hypothetical protein
MLVQTSADKFDNIGWDEISIDLQFTNVSKTFLKRLGVSNGFPVFLSVSGP